MNEKSDNNNNDLFRSNSDIVTVFGSKTLYLSNILIYASIQSIFGKDK